MYKPVSSKVNNSEAYIVCRGFRGVPDTVRDTLLKFVCADVYVEHAMLPLAIMPASFIKSAKGCGQFFAERTRAAIEDTLSKREMHLGQLKAVKDIQDFLATQWVQKFRVLKLPAELRLSPVRCPLRLFFFCFLEACPMVPVQIEKLRIFRSIFWASNRDYGKHWAYQPSVHVHAALQMALRYRGTADVVGCWRCTCRVSWYRCKKKDSDHHSIAYR